MCIYQTGSAKAPRIIRKHYDDYYLRGTTDEFGLEVGNFDQESGTIADFGDIFDDSKNPWDIHGRILAIMKDITLHNKLRPLTLGGDHSITFPLVRALVECIGKPLIIVHYDAHPDFYPCLKGDPLSHASTFTRIMEYPTAASGNPQLCTQLVQIGIRSFDKDQLDCMSGHPVEVIPARKLPLNPDDLWRNLKDRIPPDALVYVSVDIDVLDPAFAPGVSHRESGGLSTRELLNIMHAMPGKLVGCDIVEYNVDRDVDFLTADVAAKLMNELAGRLVRDYC